MCVFVVLGFVFPYQAKRLAWETSPKWPILWRMGCETLTQSINLCSRYCRLVWPLNTISTFFDYCRPFNRKWYMVLPMQLRINLWGWTSSNCVSASITLRDILCITENCQRASNISEHSPLSCCRRSVGVQLPKYRHSYVSWPYRKEQRFSIGVFPNGPR